MEDMSFPGNPCREPQCCKIDLDNENIQRLSTESMYTSLPLMPMIHHRFTTDSPQIHHGVSQIRGTSKPDDECPAYGSGTAWPAGRV